MFTFHQTPRFFGSLRMTGTRGVFKFIYSTLGLQNKAFTRGGMKNVSF